MLLGCTKQLGHPRRFALASLSVRQMSAVGGEIPFRHAQRGPFYQAAPTLQNPFDNDATLQRYLRRTVPAEMWTAISADLHRFGDRIVAEVDQLGRECEATRPSVDHFDAVGNRIDKLRLSPAWNAQKRLSAEEGLVAIGYERKFGRWSRIYQAAKLYIYSPSAGLYNCPLAMTDGCAKTIKELKLTGVKSVLTRLTSRRPEEFWTSGQWMTERRGGSDVGLGTETVATPHADGLFLLSGYKWFSSATDADVSLALAREIGSDGRPIPGSAGLSLFLLHLRNADGSLNGIEIVRLKDKLGTRQLPTAELLLDGCVAERISQPGKGVASIAHMLNITRLHNSISAAAAMRRVTSLAVDYSTKRTAFGRLLIDQPLHVRTLAQMESSTRGCFLLTMEVARLLGSVECGGDEADCAALLRLMTPLVKLTTAKLAVRTVSEGLEAFGGLGYLEDSGLPAILRDAQVLPIWEGTTNVLALDLLRILAKEGVDVTFNLFHRWVTERLRLARDIDDLKDSIAQVEDSFAKLQSFARRNAITLVPAARDLALGLSKTAMAALMVEQAGMPDATKTEVAIAQRFCRYDLISLMEEDDDYAAERNDIDKILLKENLVDSRSHL